MATPYAFVTLVSSDSYLPGALALVAALKELHPTPPSPPEVVFQTVCLVTPETVDVSSIKLLRKNFDLVVGVEIIEQLDVKGLQLLGRLDLNSVLTKLHIFRLTQYSKLIFLDADVLPVRPLSHLFNLQHEFSAVPDVGWPDIFNSGVMVLSPSEKKFEELVELLKTRGSWDGGDQGLLNEWRGNNWHRLSFIYNTTPTAAYTYAPAYERFGSQISAIHFIGPNKPWKSLPFRDPGQKLTEKSQVGPQQTYDYSSLLDRWFDVYDRHYRMATPVSRSNFEVQRYSAAWDDATSANTGNDSSISVASPIAGVYGLEDLRRIATQGYSSMESGGSGANYFAPSEGEYKSMPLEGRIDLMRPRREPSPDPAHHQLGASDNREQESLETPQQKQIDLPQGVEEMRMYTLPTPGPTEIPPAPYHHGHSLPPSETSTPYYGPPPVTYRGEQRRPVHQEEHGSLRPRLPLSQARANESDQYSSEFDTLAPRQQEWHQTKGHGHRLAHRLAVPGTEHQLQDSPRFPPHGEPRGRTASSSPVHQLGTIDPRHDVHEVHPYQPAHDTTDQPAPSDAHWQAQVRHQDTSSLKLQHSPLQRPHQHQPGHRTASHVQHQQLSGRLSPQRRSPVQHHALPHNHRVSPQHLPRSPSPPKLNWNPAVEPPPNTPPVSSAFPIDTYFPNIWDQPPSQNHDATHQTFSANPSTPQRKSPDVFFHPPPPANIPEQLLREGQYANVLGHAQTEASPDTPPGVPTPDRNKVKTVFPWEEKPRHAPRRAFPASDLPPPDKFIEAVKAFPPSRKSINHERPNLQLRTHSPPGGFPPQLSFSNAWDAVPSIQKYASNLLRPRQQSAPLPEVTDNGWRKRDKKEREKWQEQQDASSMDGDDEDEGESDGGESEGMSQSRKQRSRASSSAAAPIPAPSKGKKEYRMRGVQTLSPEMSSKAVQVTILREDGSLRPRTESSDGSLKKSVSVGIGPPVGLGIRREWPHVSSASALMPSAVPRDFKAEPEQMAGTPSVNTSIRSTMPFPSLASPTGLRSPQILGSPRTYSPPKVVSPTNAPSPPKVPSPRMSPRPGNSRRSSASGPPPREMLFVQQSLLPAPIAQPPPSAVRPGLPARRTSTSTSTPPLRPDSPVVARGQQSTPPPRFLPKLSSPFSPQLQRSTSAETNVTLSPSTTQSSLATPESTPVSTVRKGGRVWDPSRGVDVFKRGSEEVLARFLRMGSFEEGESQVQKHHVS